MAATFRHGVTLVSRRLRRLPDARSRLCAAHCATAACGASRGRSLALGDDATRYVVVSGKTAHGLSSRSGFASLRTSVPAGWTDCETILVPAPSEVDVVTTRPVALMGFLAGSTKSSGECRFWIDENWLGDVLDPARHTPEIVLDAGQHRLDVTTSEKDGLHSAWRLRLATIPDSNPDEASPANTAVVVISGYERRHGRNVCRFLTASARRQGIYLHVRGIGENYGHVPCKIVKLRRWIEELPAHYRNVLYLDARDSFFLRGLGACCSALNRCGAPILMGTERNCWPVSDAGWRESFPQQASNRRWPNSGVFIGRRRELLAALKVLGELAESNSFPPYVTYWDDQFLWQWAWMRKLLPIAFDLDCNLVTNTFAQDTRIYEANPDFVFGPELVVRDSGARPAIAHFNGSRDNSDMAAWAGFFRAV